MKLSNERKLLVHLLHSTSTVIEELNKVILVNLFSLVALVWYLLMGFGTTRFIVYISSDHLFLLVFIFGNFCKMICDGIMLAIVMHPFDIGDLCIIDNEQVIECFNNFIFKLCIRSFFVLSVLIYSMICRWSLKK